MRALIIDPGKAPKITTQLPNDEQGIARWLGGPVRMQPFGQYPAALLYTAPAGQDVPNRHYIDRWYYGRLIIVGYKSSASSSFTGTAPTAKVPFWRSWPSCWAATP